MFNRYGELLFKTMSAQLETHGHHISIKEVQSEEQEAGKAAQMAEQSSLKLMCGCLHRVWKSEDGQISSGLMVVPKIRILEVLKELHN